MKYKKASEVKALQLPPMFAECTLHPDAESGSMQFRFADTSAFLMHKGKEVGSVQGCIGGAIEFHDETVPGVTFTLSVREMWNAYQKALVSQGYKKKEQFL